MESRRDVEIGTHDAIQKNDSFYAKCMSSASSWFKKKPHFSMTNSTFDGWAMGTFTKLKKAMFNKPAEGEELKVLTDLMLREVFHELDVKHVGIIRTRQLERAMRQCGLDVSRAAIRIILQELGIDPTDGLTADDFVRFFREAEVLTKMARSDEPSIYCKTHCLILLVFSNAVVCCVFFWMYQGAVGQDRSMWLMALIGTGCSFCFFLVYLIAVQVRAMKDAGRLPTTKVISVKSSHTPALIEDSWQSQAPGGDDRPPWLVEDRADMSCIREASSSDVDLEVPIVQLEQQAEDWGESRPMVNPMLALPAATCQASCRSDEGPRDRYDPRNYAHASAVPGHRNCGQPVPYFNPLCSADRSQPTRVRRVQAGLYTVQPAPTIGPFVNRGVAQGSYRY